MVSGCVHAPTSATLSAVSTLGYARVGTDHQSLDQQHDALAAAGCERVFTDQLSGIRDDRPGLAALLDSARAGDTVVVVALDRLGRSLSGIIRTVETLTEAGVLLRSLREGIDYSTATGRMLAGIFAALRLRTRTHARARRCGPRDSRRPRPPHRPPTQAHRRQNTPGEVRALRAGGESISELVAGFGVSRATIYRALSHDADAIANL